MATKPVAIFIFAASIAFSLFGCASTPKEAHETKEVNTAYMSRIDAVVAKDISKTAGTFYTAPVDETKSFSTADNQAVMWVKSKPHPSGLGVWVYFIRHFIISPTYIL